MRNVKYNVYIADKYAGFGFDDSDQEKKSWDLNSSKSWRNQSRFTILYIGQGKGHSM